MHDANCLFCKIIANEIPAEKVHEDDQCIVIKDISPQAPVHLLVIPKKHIPTTNAITETDKSLIGHLQAIGVACAKEAGIAESGYRMLFNCNRDAGQEVFHIHCHILGGKALPALG